MFEKCPCGTGATYLACCAPIHTGKRAAATPEELMRSRYTAFVRQDAGYLLASWHPDTRPPSIGDLAGKEWLGLTIHEAPQPDGDAGAVRFTARLRVRGFDTAVRETSRFRRENGRWLYLDGEVD